MWHAFGITFVILCKTLNFTAMKTKIYLSLLIVIAVVGTAMAGSNERKDSALEQNISMAEMEFVSQCHDLHEICKKNLDNLGSCLPEVIIVDRNYNFIVSGLKANYLIEQFLYGSDYLTNVLGIDYYSLNYEISWSPERMTVAK